MKQLEKITLAFENVDIACIYAEKVKAIWAAKIQETIAYRPHQGCIRNKIAYDMAIELDECCNNVKTRYMEDFNEGGGLFRRILDGNDIVSITLRFSDGTEEEICTDFDGEYSNSNQKARIARDGTLQIVIGENASLEKAFRD